MDYVNPSEVVGSALSAAKRKVDLPVRDLLLRGVLAGGLLGYATSLAQIVVSQGVPPIVSAILFPAGFVILVLLGLDETVPWRVDGTPSGGVRQGRRGAVPRHFFGQAGPDGGGADRRKRPGGGSLFAGRAPLRSPRHGANLVPRRRFAAFCRGSRVRRRASEPATDRRHHSCSGRTLRPTGGYLHGRPR